jgi:hypothetical protein
MNVVLSCVRLVEMKSNMIPINEPVVMAEGNRKLPVILECVAIGRVASVVVGIGFLIGVLGCDRIVTAHAVREQAVLGSDLRVQMVDLGLVVQGGRERELVRIEASDQEDIEILEIRSSCECVSVKLDSHMMLGENGVLALVETDLSHQPDFLGCLQVTVELVGKEGVAVAQLDVRLSVIRTDLGSGLDVLTQRQSVTESE